MVTRRFVAGLASSVVNVTVTGVELPLATARFAVLGVATASFREMRIQDALLGAAVGFLVVWLPFVVIYPRVRGKVGMGLGDAKLLMLAGAWFGWSGALVVIGAGAGALNYTIEQRAGV